MLKPTEQRAKAVDTEKERRRLEREKVKKMRDEFYKRDQVDFISNFDNRPREARLKGGV